MKIRDAKADDFVFLIEGMEEIRKLEGNKNPKASKKDKADSRKAIKNKNVRIVEIKGQPVGFLYFKTDYKLMYVYERFLWVQRIYIRKSFRGKGLARELYKEAISIAKKRKFKKIFCDVYDINEVSKEVHLKLGFNPVYTIYEKEVK